VYRHEVIDQFISSFKLYPYIVFSLFVDFADIAILSQIYKYQTYPKVFLSFINFQTNFIKGPRGMIL